MLLKFMEIASQIRLKLVLFLVSCALLAHLPERLEANSPVEAKVGIYVMNVFDMDMTSNSFYADFYLWMKWKGEIDPSKGISFENLVEQGSFILTPLLDADSVLADGHNYRSFRIEGRFFNPFDVSDFPMDRQFLRLVLENDIYDNRRLVYKLDESPSAIDDAVVISGWQLGELTVSSSEKKYKTDFGLMNTNHIQSFSTLTFSLSAKRPFNFFVWKLLFPLLIVIVSSIAFMFFEAKDFSARFYLPVYALLTIVFMQMGYAAYIPESSYLVLMDKIYVAAYALIIANMAQIILFSRLASTGKHDEHRINTWDRVISIACTLAFISYIILAVTLVLVR